MNQEHLTHHVEDCFLYLAITDTGFLKTVRHCVDPGYFRSKMVEDLVRICYSHYDQCNSAPGSKKEGDHFWDLVERRLYKASDEEVRNYYKYIQKINKLGEDSPPNRAYVESVLNKFIITRELESSVVEAADELKKGHPDRARGILQSAVKVGIPEREGGIRFPGEGLPEFYREGGSGELICPIGIDLIDRRVKGIRRNQLVCFFGGYKVGKTWGCGLIAHQALKYGKKVVFISHEASEQEIQMRLFMSFGALTNNLDDSGNPYDEDVEFVEYDVEGNKVATHTDSRGSVFDIENIEKVRRKVSRWNSDNIFIKKYPMATCTVGEIERYLDYLELSEHFIPDVVISDYVEKMKLPSNKDSREGINDTYINLKRIADERHIAVITASQIKTQSLEKSVIRDADAPSEDARKLGNIDIGIFFGIDKKLERRGLMSAYVLVNRSGPHKFGCRVSRNLKVGQFAIDSFPLKDSDDE